MQAIWKIFNVLSVHVFVLRLRRRNDSSETCVASVTMSDGLALVKFARMGPSGVFPKDLRSWNMEI